MSSFAIGFSQYALYGIIDINADEKRGMTRMNMIQKAVTDALDSLHIDYEITEHPPVYTIDEMKNLGITHKGMW